MIHFESPRLNCIATRATWFAYSWNATGSGPCRGGYYCPSGSFTAAQYSCTNGTFCPAGSANAKICTPGDYCSTTGLSAVSGPCSVGYYCPRGSTLATQEACSAGYYCGSTGFSSMPLQNACSAGFYCPSASTAATGNGTCSVGYYCSAGSSSATQAPCDAGFYCPAGSSTINQGGPCPVGATCDKSSDMPRIIGQVSSSYFGIVVGVSSSVLVLAFIGSSILRKCPLVIETFIDIELPSSRVDFFNFFFFLFVPMFRRSHSRLLLPRQATSNRMRMLQVQSK